MSSLYGWEGQGGGCGCSQCSPVSTPPNLPLYSPPPSLDPPHLSSHHTVLPTITPHLLASHCSPLPLRPTCLCVCVCVCRRSWYLEVVGMLRTPLRVAHLAWNPHLPELALILENGELRVASTTTCYSQVRAAAAARGGGGGSVAWCMGVEEVQLQSCLVLSAPQGGLAAPQGGLHARAEAYRGRPLCEFGVWEGRGGGGEEGGGRGAAEQYS